MGFRIGAALTIALFVPGCGDSAQITTDLSALSNAQQDFNGQKVIVSGILRTFDSPRHFWIENHSYDRVALHGVGDLAPLLGQQVEVRGRFFYDRESGRRIQVEALFQR